MKTRARRSRRGGARGWSVSKGEGVSSPSSPPKSPGTPRTTSAATKRLPRRLPSSKQHPVLRQEARRGRTRRRGRRTRGWGWGGRGRRWGRRWGGKGVGLAENRTRAVGFRVGRPTAVPRRAVGFRAVHQPGATRSASFVKRRTRSSAHTRGRTRGTTRRPLGTGSSPRTGRGLFC